MFVYQYKINIEEENAAHDTRRIRAAALMFQYNVTLSVHNDLCQHPVGWWAEPEKVPQSGGFYQSVIRAIRPGWWFNASVNQTLFISKDDPKLRLNACSWQLKVNFWVVWEKLGFDTNKWESDQFVTDLILLYMISLNSFVPYLKKLCGFRTRPYESH